MNKAQEMRSRTLELCAANHTVVRAVVERLYATVLEEVEACMEQGYCLFSPEGLSQSETDLLRDKLENEGFTVFHTPSSTPFVARKNLRIEWMDAEEILL